MNTYKNSKIKSIKAREILDSRGNWTVEVDLTTELGLFRDSVPSGASKGKYEAPTMDSKKAVKNVNEIIASKLKGKDPTKQKEIDSLLDPVQFGANATCGVSMAVCRAGAAAKNLPLWKYISQYYKTRPRFMPRPAFNVINGGVHADNELDFQEFMIVPRDKTFRKSLEKASKLYQDLRKKLGKNVGDEGGFAPLFRLPEQALELLTRTFLLQEKRSPEIIIDVAASQLYTDESYKMNFGVFTREGLIRYYASLIQKYPIIAIEDPFAEEDWEGFKAITKKFANHPAHRLIVIGDDLLVTNPKRIKEAHDKKACNGLLLKVNQIGTVSKAIEAAKLAQFFGWKVMVSHRSGETCDDFIADLAVGIGADFIKAGAPARGERVAKYNRLLRIEEEL